MDKEKLRGKVFGNFNRSSRWLGIIDYKSLFFFVSYIFGFWNITKLFNLSLISQIYILIIFTIPVVVLVLAYIDEESVVDMLFIIFKFCLRKKWYVYILKDDVNVITKRNFKKRRNCIENVYKSDTIHIMNCRR